MESANPLNGCGKVIKVTEKKDKHGLGYQPSSQSSSSSKGAQIPLISQIFTSAGISYGGQVLAVDDEVGNDADISQFIY